MKVVKQNLFLGLLLVSLSAVTIFSGCRKKEDTIAKIYVRDSANLPVAGAQVVLYGTPTVTPSTGSVVHDTTVTNSSGEAIFNFNEVYQLGQAGVAVLDIEATKDGATAKGIIKIEQETTSEETVFLPL
jgi:hypothetical protein